MTEKENLGVILEKINGLSEKINDLENDISAVQKTMQSNHESPCNALAILGAKKDALCTEVQNLKSDFKSELAKLQKAVEGANDNVKTLSSQNSISFDGFANRQDSLRSDINSDLRELKAELKADVEDARCRSRKKHDVLLMRLMKWETIGKTAYAILTLAISSVAWWLSR